MSTKTSKIAAEMNTLTDLSADAWRRWPKALNGCSADAFALYLKTKNFHWHLSGRHFRDYHLMLDEQSDQIFATTDLLAERAQDRRSHAAFDRRSRQAADHQGQ